MYSAFVHLSLLPAQVHTTPFPFFLADPRCVVAIFTAELLLRRRRGKDCGTVQGGSRLVGVVNGGQAFRGAFF